MDNQQGMASRADNLQPECLVCGSDAFPAGKTLKDSKDKVLMEIFRTHLSSKKDLEPFEECGFGAEVIILCEDCRSILNDGKCAAEKLLLLEGTVKKEPSSNFGSQPEVKCEDKESLRKEIKLKLEREKLKLEIKSGSFDLKGWIYTFLKSGGTEFPEMKRKLRNSCYDYHVNKNKLNYERKDFMKGYDVPLEEYCGKCFKSKILSVVRLEDVVGVILSTNYN